MRRLELRDFPDWVVYVHHRIEDNANVVIVTNESGSFAKATVNGDTDDVWVDIKEACLHMIENFSSLKNRRLTIHHITGWDPRHMGKVWASRYGEENEE